MKGGVILGKGKIASQTEILEFFTNVMRRADDDDVKLSDAMNAADKLHKYHQQKKEKSEDKEISGIVILPEVKKKEETE